MQPLVSVIVPVYKVEKYLENCVESILNQSYKNLEIILVDDGSPDRGGEICENYAKNDPRIVVIKKENGGLSSARNAGMRVAKAAYWCFVDSDDWIADNMIELMMECFTSDIDLVCCGRVLRGFKRDTALLIKNSVCFNSAQAIEYALFDKEIGIAAWGKIYRKSLFDNIGFPEGEINEDAAIMLQIFHRARKIFVLDKALYYYRYNAEGISKSAYNTKCDVVLKHSLDNEKFVLDHYPEIQSKGKAMVAKGCFGIMIRILKTENGFETFNNQFKENRHYYIRYLREFCKYCDRPKEYVWMLILLSCNEVTIKMFRKLRIAQ